MSLALPNIRKLFLPDMGQIIGDFDLAQADAQVVAWEANDDILKEIFRDPARDLHSENAADLGVARPLAKAGVHAVNYGVRPRTLATTLGITVREAEAFITRWFDIHPGIADWHERIKDQLETNRTVTNKFGYRRQYFDRVDNLFTQAVAWIPQSTVALIINRAIIALDRPDSRVDFLMQVHDSVIYQWHPDDQRVAVANIRAALEQPVPYEDPLIIPCGAKISNRSWGDAVNTCLDCFSTSFYEKPMPEVCTKCNPGMEKRVG